MKIAWFSVEDGVDVYHVSRRCPIGNRMFVDDLGIALERDLEGDMKRCRRCPRYGYLRLQVMD